MALSFYFSREVIGLLIEDHIMTTWSTTNKKHFVDKGYIFTGLKTDLFVHVHDLPVKSGVKIKVICDYCGEIIDQTYHNYLRGKNNKISIKDCCKKCLPTKIREIYRQKIECDLFPRIINEFQERNYELLSSSDEYNDNTSMLSFYCNKHREKGILKTSYTNFTISSGCKYCGGESISKSKTLNYDFVKNEFEKMNYRLLESKYISAKTKMKYICNVHCFETQEVMYTNLKKGRACKYCGLEKISGENNFNWQGGISKIVEYLRHKTIPWRIASLVNGNYRCDITDVEGDIEVHHLYSFSKIIKEIFLQTGAPIRDTIADYTIEELNILEQKNLEFHSHYGLGVCLHKSIHKNFHMIYGRTNNTIDQYEQFKDNYLSGECAGMIAV